ncbi:hypothetical protein SAMN05216312_1224 [Cohnella sp. OV330]|nr:hypothetical protein SAMN05216312_1224 [Cohnella sp. OV330]
MKSLASNANVVEEGSPEDKLGDIRNFVTSDIWNSGFIDVSNFIRRGTGSTGETLDIDFTMERLAKSMEQKKEYDEYINGLGEEYADIKSVWTKLSGEIDKLYEHLKQNPPKANTTDEGFDTALFQQYSEAFRDDVTELISKKQ